MDNNINLDKRMYILSQKMGFCMLAHTNYIPVVLEYVELDIWVVSHPTISFMTVTFEPDFIGNNRFTLPQKAGWCCITFDKRDAHV